MSAKTRLQKSREAAESFPLDASQYVDNAAVKSVESELSDLSDEPGSLEAFIDDGKAQEDDNQGENESETADGADGPEGDAAEYASEGGAPAITGIVTAATEASSIDVDLQSPEDVLMVDANGQANLETPYSGDDRAPSNASIAKRKRQHRKSTKPVYDSESDQDTASALIAGDKMFVDARGVKSSLLAPPLRTRSAVLLSEVGGSVVTDTVLPKLSSNASSSSQPVVATDLDANHSSDLDADQREGKKQRVSQSSSRQISTKSSSKKKSKKPEVVDDGHMSEAMQGTVKTMMQSELPGIADAVLARLLPALKDVLAATSAPLQPALAAPQPIEPTSALVDTANRALTTPFVARHDPAVMALPSVEPTVTPPAQPVPGEVSMPATANSANASVAPPVVSLQPSAMDASPASEHDIARSSSKLPIGVGFTSLSTQSPVTPSKPTGKERAVDPSPTKIDMSSMTFFNSSFSAEPAPVSDNAKSSPSKTKILAGLEGMASATRVKEESVEDGVPMAGKGAFLDDIEAYKLNYDPSYPCQVADLELQDKLLVGSYKGLPPLPNRSVLPSFTRNDASEDEVKGGRVRFSVWPKVVKNCTAATISGAVTFEKSGLYINPSRVSPVDVTVRPTKQGTKTTSHMRINVDNSVATCVSCGMCVESWVTRTAKTFGSNPREYKCISLVMHNQDWERWAAWMCLCFNEQQLYASMSGRAIQIRSIMSNPDDDNNRSWAGSINPDIMKPVRSANSSPTKFKTKYALGHDETVPVYDCTNHDLDMDEELQSMDSLPRWKGEVPVGSFVIVGYSASTYPGTVGGSGPKVAHLSCNLLWAIVCGIPK
ncbi:hypothetical protein C8F04DRAFT_1324377 [Mycena alexandri]|uniref:Uncharacterized protein n=1 Tax=Mycena alexandri TaxID=1745969 RepID=A0AAD6T3J3_9AGAR|nr:hypothetical protein C8F04DRAFT_1324377 [Mycena alexandri]